MIKIELESLFSMNYLQRNDRKYKIFAKML